MTKRKNNNENINKIIPKNDIVFKRLFGSVGSESILKDLLEAILDIKIQSVKLDLDKEIMPKNIRGKRNILDVRTTLEDGTQINIEMQMTTPKDLEKRNLDYWANLYVNQLKKGKKYKNLKKTIAIWILDEGFFEDIPEYHTTWVLKERKNNYAGYFEDLELHFLELNKVRKNAIIKPKKLDFWMWFIDYTNKEMVKMAYENEEQVREALEKLRELSADSALVDLMMREDFYEMDQIDRLEAAEEAAEKRGLERGIERGIEKGKQEQKKEVARKMLKKGIDIEVIIETTELTIEEIEQLKKDV